MIERISDFLFDCWCWGDHVEQIKSCLTSRQRFGAVCTFAGAVFVTLLTLPLLLLVAQIQYGSMTLFVFSMLQVIGGLRVFHRIWEGTFGDTIDWLVTAVVAGSYILWITTSVFCYYSEKKKH